MRFMRFVNLSNLENIPLMRFMRFVAVEAGKKIWQPEQTRSIETWENQDFLNLGDPEVFEIIRIIGPGRFKIS